MDKIANTNMIQSSYYPILMYKPDKLIQINFDYTIYGTTKKQGFLYLYNENIYTDYDITGLHVVQINNDYYLTCNNVTSYSFNIISSDGNAYRDGNYFIDTNFSSLEDIKTIHENGDKLIIKSYEYTGLTEETTHLIYNNNANRTKLILLKIGERKSSGIRAWGLYLIVIKGSTSSASTTMTSTLIEGDETNKDYNIVQNGQKTNLVMSPTVSTRYTFEIIG